MAAVGRLAYVGIDAVEPKKLALFYADLLGVDVRWEQDDGTYVVLKPPAPGATTMLFQRVAEPTPGKNRLHVDFHVADLERATAQSLAAGADVEREVTELEITWRVMRDPEGNLFCLVHHPEEG